MKQLQCSVSGSCYYKGSAELHKCSFVPRPVLQCHPADQAYPPTCSSALSVLLLSSNMQQSLCSTTSAFISPHLRMNCHNCTLAITCLQCWIYFASFRFALQSYTAVHILSTLCLFDCILICCVLVCLRLSSHCWTSVSCTFAYLLLSLYISSASEKEQTCPFSLSCFFFTPKSFIFYCLYSIDSFSIVFFLLNWLGCTGGSTLDSHHKQRDRKVIRCILGVRKRNNKVLQLESPRSSLMTSNHGKLIGNHTLSLTSHVQNI